MKDKKKSILIPLTVIQAGHGILMKSLYRTQTICKEMGAKAPISYILFILSLGS